MATRRRQQWSLCLLLLLALVYLIASIHTLESLDFVNALVRPVVSLTGWGDATDTQGRTSQLVNSTSQTSGPWRIQSTDPMPRDPAVTCDSRALSQWPDWMKPLSSSEYEQANTYRSVLQEFPHPHSQEEPFHLPLPLQILEEYRQQHSVESLIQFPGCRKFIIATYRCPHSAGNRLHEFANDFLWAVVLNRTVLYKYLDESYCSELQTKFHFVNDDAQCTMNNTINDCATILDRAPWIPSWDEWQHRLGLPPAEYMTTHDYGSQSGHLLSHKGIDVAYNHVPVLGVRPVSRRFDTFGRFPLTIPLKFKQNATMVRVQALFSMGHRYLFGLLFRSAFDIRPEFRTSARQGHSSDEGFTMAIHSRHVAASDDGCNITLEEECLAKVRQNLHGKVNATNPCSIVVMSDRPCALSALKDHFTNQKSPWKCSVLIADHEEGSGILSEHGPFAAAGFFQDLYFTASIARTAMIGSSQPPQFDTWRTSSELLEELIDYNRIMDAWQQGEDPTKLPDLIRCGLRRG